MPVYFLVSVCVCKYKYFSTQLCSVVVVVVGVVGSFGSVGLLWFGLVVTFQLFSVQFYALKELNKTTEEQQVVVRFFLLFSFIISSVFFQLTQIAGLRKCNKQEGNT